MLLMSPRLKVRPMVCEPPGVRERKQAVAVPEGAPLELA